MLYTDRYDSPLGRVTLAGREGALTGLWLEGQPIAAADLPAGCIRRELPVFSDVKRWLDLYFQGEEPPFTPPLDPQGTPFRQEVWWLLCRIPYGHTVTYGQIARHLAARHGLATMSAQAVGGAVGHNPISLIVPCHRVVGAGGRLTGYAGGVDKKEKLLALERAAPPQEPCPWFDAVPPNRCLKSGGVR